MTTTKLKTLAAAALALAIASPTFAATYDFSFDASTAISGDTSLMAFGTLDIDAAAGSTFDNSDISNVSITASSSEFYSNLTFNATDDISGMIAADGLSAIFSNFRITYTTGSQRIFGCFSACSNNEVEASHIDDYSSAFFSSQSTTLAAFTATAQVSAVPLPAGGLLLLSGLAGVIGLKRRKKRAA